MQNVKLPLVFTSAIPFEDKSFMTETCYGFNNT
jgi:hypothetical protein